mgnify:CR=1 FL=1|jgi:hypothetical protein|tara:strand:- start:350 stop:577 length:228 start_codon:yes stop_codon:yes gene_type:complete
MRRSSSTIPFGYKLDDNNVELLTPIPEQLEQLDKMIIMIKQKTLSLREAALFLEHKTGRIITHMGLKKIADKRDD